MYKIGDYLVYRKDVCLVKDIIKKHFNDEDYYILEPVNDNSLKIEIPTSNKNIRELMTKSEVEALIKEIPSITVIETENKLIENDYKQLLKDASREDLVKVIKTTYMRNKLRLDNKKTKSDKDDTYFKLAEKYLYTELSVVLDMSYDEAKNYIINKVDGLANEV